MQRGAEHVIRRVAPPRPPPQAAVAHPRRLARHRTVGRFAVPAHQMKIKVASAPRATPNSCSMCMQLLQWRGYSGGPHAGALYEDFAAAWRREIRLITVIKTEKE